MYLRAIGAGGRVPLLGPLRAGLCLGTARRHASNGGGGAGEGGPQRAASRGGDGVAVPEDMPAPPRPSAYVPPAERDVTDASLSFLREDDPLLRRHAAAVAEQQRRDGVRLGAGQDFAPQVEERSRPARIFRDADAARVQSSSVNAGRSLLPRGEPTVGTGGYYAGAAALPPSDDADGPERRSRLRVLRPAAAADRPEGVLAAGSSAEDDPQRRNTVFGAKHEFARLEDIVGEEGGGLPRPPPPIFGTGPGSSAPDQLDSADGDGVPQQQRQRLPLAKQIERDIKKLEYYHGSPQYAELLRQFREKYGDETADGQSPREKEEQQKYSEGEVAQGLDNQPIDFHRASAKMQAQLSSGPYGYNPVTIMQQHGVMRFQGYAFPPTTELGKLKGVGDLQALQDAHRRTGLVAATRRSFNALIGRKDAREDYIATADTVKPDNHLLFRTLKLDAAQRRQMRYMLTDFDYKDRNTAFHVMMSYPYTDWIHVFFMVVVGWCLYQLQVRFGAYEFYDEYLGLDLRQVPSVKKPFLVGVTVVVMLFLMFQPLLVASIATNRAYRIAMRRPIGPP